MQKEELSIEIISPSMRVAVEKIQEMFKNKGQEVAIDELADKVNITSQQLSRYMQDEKDMPADLSKRLLAAYKIQLVSLTHKIRKTPPLPLPAPSNHEEQG